MTVNNYKIILVDDEEKIVKSLYRELRHETREIRSFTDTEEAVNHIMNENIDLVISDYRMPKMNGVDFLSKVKNIQPEVISILLSGNSDLDFLKDAINQAGIYRFLSKPWDSFQLKTVISHALEFKTLQSENKRLADEVRQKNDHIQQQREEIERLELMQPGITQVNWDNDGAIIIDENSIQ